MLLMGDVAVGGSQRCLQMLRAYGTPERHQKHCNRYRVKVTTHSQVP